MKLWIIYRKKQKIVRDAIFPLRDGQTWDNGLSEFLENEDTSRPVILSKHENEAEQFNRVVFSPSDFIEAIDFDRLEVEIIEEDKDKK